MHPRVVTTKLDNGFRIVSEKMAGLRSASVGIWVDVGARHERPEENGIAHFLEHMAFKGTNRRNALEIAEAIEDVGGYINAYTSREMTAYYARVLGEHVGLAVDVLSDIVLHSVFDPKELEIERGVILQEIGQVLDTPDDVIFDWLQELSYPQQAMGRAILGPSERVKAFAREDLKKFVAQHYGPEQMVLSAAGDVDHDALVKQAEHFFGGLKPLPQRARAAASFGGGEDRRIKGLEQAHFALGFESLGYRDDNIYSAQIAAMVLGGGMSSRLFQEIREKRGLCYSIYASLGAFSDTGLLTVYAGTSQEQIGELVDVTAREIVRAKHDLTEAEVERARVQLKSGMVMGLESPTSRCERQARMTLIWDRVPRLKEVIERIEATDLNQVKATLAEMGAQTSPSLVLYGPVEGAPDHGDIARQLAA